MTTTATRRKRKVVLPPELARVINDPKAKAALEREIEQRLATRRVELYQPYEKQASFHAAGAMYRERALLAGNQQGKTYSAGAETAYHLTGDYPDWWQGRRFSKPTAGWAAGVTSEATRDTAQRILLGRAESIGTGLIPKKRIKNTTSARGIADAIDTAFIEHASGGVSQITFKSYEERRSKWQGETLDFVWMDEEPPYDLYSEALSRTNATGGIVYCTFTPLEGMTETVRLFYPRPTSADRHTTMMTIDDALHISAEQRAKIVASYKPHEREARTRGIPQLGSGAIIVVPESTWVTPAFTVPSFWPGIIGIDLGFDHPFGAAMLRWDRDTDTVFVTATHRAVQQTILQQASVLKAWGGYPVAWPHDAASHDRASGEPMAALYRKQGLNMLHEHATFAAGGYSLEASIADLIERMETGRFKVFEHVADLREEFRTWHRKDGKVVKQNDDVISAVRYGLMMLRYAQAAKGASSSGPLRRSLRHV
ncbi:terminase-like family protein [Microcystis phage MJing1]|nr:terminase-like family protein [Microcystis phage MJing1]